MTSFDLDHFQRFLNALRIATKEEGVIRLGAHLLGSQRMFLVHLRRALAEDVHEIVWLKARQLGASTLCNALDLYYPSLHPGLSGALVVHDEPARDQFRSTIEMYRDGLPEEWRIEDDQHNRNQLIFSNGSRLMYKVAGLKEKSSQSLGRSAALTFLHATEVAFWGDPKQISSLKKTLAQKNANRLYLWESTANGFNHFFDMWTIAKKSVSQRAVFIGWWANEYYRAAQDGEVFRTYWGLKGRLSPEEREKVREVKALYGVDVEPEQVAWYRWQAAEGETEEDMLAQEYPWHEHEAFIATGSAFFTSVSINDAYKRILREPKPDAYRLHIGRDFTDTQLVSVQERIATLRVWEAPKPRGVAMYALGADPAYGSSENADKFSIAVYRCWSNRMEQVAEFVTPDISTYAFAWVIVYLAGAYEPCVVNLEVNGPGQAVLNEIQNLKKAANMPMRAVADAKILQDVTRAMGQYLYKKLDSLSGMPGAIHTITNLQMKERMLGAFKDYFERGILIPHSRSLVDEMKSIVRKDGGAPEAASDAHDDRVIASALACVAWNDQMRTRLIGQNIIWTPPEDAVRGPEEITPVVVRQVQNYLQYLGVTRRPQAGEKRRMVSLDGQAPPRQRR